MNINSKFRKLNVQSDDISYYLLGIRQSYQIMDVITAIL